jgi:hypothetical protein
LHDVAQQRDKLDDVNVLHLRPTYFMESLLAKLGMINTIDVNGSDIKGDAKFAMIATKGIGAALSAVSCMRMLAADFF